MLMLKTFLYFSVGPAGTGKTESVKALGSQLGRFVLVMNCKLHMSRGSPPLKGTPVIRSCFSLLLRRHNSDVL